MSTPATDLNAMLENIAKKQGPQIAVNVAEIMIAAGVAALIRERGGRYAYAQVQKFADDIAFEVIAKGRYGNGD